MVLTLQTDHRQADRQLGCTKCYNHDSRQLGSTKSLHVSLTLRTQHGFTNYTDQTDEHTMLMCNLKKAPTWEI